MIESRNDTSKNLEKALQALKQAQQLVANEKKKQNEKKRKAENHHKYIMGGIIVKYFPDCYRYDEDELNRILSVALQTKECQQIIFKIKSESRGNVFTLFTGCAQIYHQRWYVRSPKGKFHLHGSPLRFGRRRADVHRTSALRPAEGIVCLATAKRGNDNSPSQAALATL